MTERGASALQRDANTLAIGPSRLAWRGGRLEIEVDEWAVPWPTRLRGRIVLHPLSEPGAGYALDAAGRHRWTPLAPCARVEVRFERPAWHWQGAAYLDSNGGERPLEADFRAWDWSRAALPGGRAGVHYDVTRSDGSTLSLALQFDAAGQVGGVAAPPLQDLRASRWGLRGQVRADPGHAPTLLRRLEDGPFYARSLLATHWRGEPVVAVHESLSLQRFGAHWVQALLPFRMPRRPG